MRRCLLGLLGVGLLACQSSPDDGGAGSDQTVVTIVPVIGSVPGATAPPSAGSVAATAAGSPATAVAPPAAAAPTTTVPAPTTSQPPALTYGSDVGRPWGSAVAGLLTFRGNPSRTYHGAGPVPAHPSVLWRYPDSGMCGLSSEYGETRTWCGTGWVGQPAVFERDGRTWVVFGAYDYQFHFLDAATGKPILPPFPTGDIAKGTVTVDPDGFPLVYGGSRDNKLRVLAIDRPEAVELWALDSMDEALQPRLWNSDWDAAPLIVGDYLVTGGENSRFHVVRLNRCYGPDGLVQVAPELVFTAPAWDDELLANLPDDRVSVENAVDVGRRHGVLHDVGRAGAGLGPEQPAHRSGRDHPHVPLLDGRRHRRHDRRRRGGLPLRRSGVGPAQRPGPRGRPAAQARSAPKPDNPVVWSIPDQGGEQAGTWSTPALYRDTIIWPTYLGPMYGIDRATGAIRWTIELPWAVMSSPIVVDDVLMQADATGAVHAWDLTTPGTPSPLWTVQLPANIESTPALWKGRLYVGTRDGYFYAIGDG